MKTKTISNGLWHVYSTFASGVTEQSEFRACDKDAARRLCAKLWNLPVRHVAAHLLSSCDDRCAEPSVMRTAKSRPRTVST